MEMYILIALVIISIIMQFVCKDATRYYYGGTSGEILSEKPVSLEAFIKVCEISTMANDRGKSRKLGLKRVNLYSNNRNTQNLPNSFSFPNPHCRNETESLKYLNSTKNNTFDWDKCAERVTLFRKFIEGEWLTHPQLFGLATSLVWIKGGSKLMKETMKKYNALSQTRYTSNNFCIIPYVKFRDYFPQYLQDFSPYPEDHEYTNLIAAVRDRRGEIEIVSIKPKLTLAEAEQKLGANWERIIKEDTNKIYLLKCATGLGKTRGLINVENALIAAPTNKLKNEIFDKMKVPAMVTPDPPGFENTTLADRITGLYRMGLYKKAYEIIKETAKANTPDGLKALEFISKNKEVHDSNNVTIITTHERAMHNDFKFQTLIFDEDPYQAYNEIRELKIGDVANLKRHMPELAPLEQFLNHLEPGKVVPVPTFDINTEKLFDNYPESVAKGNVFGVIRSSHVIIEKENICYITHRKFPEDKKVIISSATVDENLYRQLYGDRVEIVNLENVEGLGKIIQHTSKSYSRESLKFSNLSNIKKMTDGKPVITFIEHSAYFNGQPLGIHHGNCQGYDELKGKDIVVLGTPHINNSAYKLQAAILGIDTSKDKMSFKKIDWNGCRFKFMCYDDEQLRKIQLNMISAQLIQAVGRARTIRTSACVTVYSNLPLFLTDEFKYDDAA